MINAIGTINAITDHVIDMNDADNNMVNSTTNINVNLNCIAIPCSRHLVPRALVTIY